MPALDLSALVGPSASAQAMVVIHAVSHHADQNHQPDLPVPSAGGASGAAAAPPAPKGAKAAAAPAAPAAASATVSASRVKSEVVSAIKAAPAAGKVVGAAEKSPRATTKNFQEMKASHPTNQATGSLGDAAAYAAERKLAEEFMVRREGRHAGWQARAAVYLHEAW